MNKQQLATRIWAITSNMRSKIAASEYKDYILGFIFYKYLSEAEIQYALHEGMESDEFVESLVESNQECAKHFKNNIGYFIPYCYLFSTWINKKINLSLSDITDGLSCFKRNIGSNYQKVFNKIFDSIVVSKLGASTSEQTKAIREMIELINKIPTDGKANFDVLGYIYEFLIGKFAASAGKSAGEFYTPHEVSQLMSLIVAEHLKNVGVEKADIYDPTSGSASLLITIGKAASKYIDPSKITYYAQEKIESTYNLTRMNLVMRGIKPDNIKTRCGDTLDKDWPWFEMDEDGGIRENTYQLMPVDAVVSNPPYSLPWSAPKKNKQRGYDNLDPRYERFGVAPKGKADYAFLLHDLFHLKDNGILTCILPHGVLFRGNPGNINDPKDKGDLAEGSIRRNLIENGHIETIVGLPDNIFYGTGISTAILILKKRREERDVLFVDASKCCKKDGKKNVLRQSDIRKIFDAVCLRKDIPHFARLVGMDEIIKNEYNLNISRYVDDGIMGEQYDIRATMLGGIPWSEVDELKEYWNVFTGLKEQLFNVSDNNYTNSIYTEDTIGEAIKNNDSVCHYQQTFSDSLEGFEPMLEEKLLGKDIETLNIAKVEEDITKELFLRFENVPLADNYAAYQLFSDKWAIISQDLEMIQTESFASATHKVDDIEKLEKDKKTGKLEPKIIGKQGRILPFDIVQKNFLEEQFNEIEDIKVKISNNESTLQNILENLSEEEKSLEWINDEGEWIPSGVTNVLKSTLESIEDERIDLLEEYLTLNKASEKKAFIENHCELEWSRISSRLTPIKSDISNEIKQIRLLHDFEEDTTEFKIVEVARLQDENKQLKAKLKECESKIELETINIIENGLTDDQVRIILRQKWIEGLTEYLHTLPGTIVSSFVSKVKSLLVKYQDTLVDLDTQIKSESETLVSLFEDLSGSKDDMDGIKELIKMLKLDSNESES